MPLTARASLFATHARSGSRRGPRLGKPVGLPATSGRAGAVRPHGVALLSSGAPGRRLTTGHLVVSGDIGGTNARFTLWEGTSAEDFQCVMKKSYLTEHYPEFIGCLKQFLADTETSELPQAVCIAAAGPVSDNACVMTNLKWTVSGQEIHDQLGISEGIVINDFEAVGYGVPCLTKDRLMTLNQGQYQEHMPRVCIGAGTGLGQALIVYVNDIEGFKVIPSEGGHATYAPRGDRQRDLQAWVEEKEKYCEIEHLLCGEGLKRILGFIQGQTSGDDEDLEPKQITERGTCIGTCGSPKLVACRLTFGYFDGAGLSGECDMCSEALDIFLESIGAEAGHMALRSLAYGGVYIAGGITQKLMRRVDEGGLLKSFLWEESRFNAILQDIPLHVVSGDDAGLIGFSVMSPGLAACRCTRGSRQGATGTGGHIGRQNPAAKQVADSYYRHVPPSVISISF
eukprot:scaffold527_cov368-Prasinococcus_capsulatus_cf.AAC.49